MQLLKGDLYDLCYYGPVMWKKCTIVRWKSSYDRGRLVHGPYLIQTLEVRPLSSALNKFPINGITKSENVI